MSRAPSTSLENAPLLTPNDLDEEETLDGGNGVVERGPRTREAPRDHTNFFPLRHGKFSHLETLLAFMCVLLLILMSVFAGLYARGRTNKHPQPEIPPPIIPPPNDTIKEPCLTPDCVIIAAQIISDMDPTADPCDDFFQYSCGGWVQNNLIPEDKGQYSYFDSLYEDNQKLLKEILENNFESTHKFEPNLPPPSEVIDKQNFYKLQNLYQSCMNESLINDFGGEPLLPIIDRIIDDFPVDSKYSLLSNFGHLDEIESQGAHSHDPLNLTNTLSRLSIFGIKPLFEFFVEADAKDPKNNVLYLSQSGLGLPSKEYYEEEEILLSYKEAMIELLNLALNYSSNVAHHFNHNFTESDDLVKDILEYSAERFLYKEWEKNAKKIIDFEIELAKISLSAEEFSDPEATYNNQTVVSLENLSPSFIWTRYISALLPPTSVFPAKIILTSNKYFKDLSNLVEKTPTPTLQLYFIWQAIYTYADSLSENFRVPLRKLRAKLRGTDESIKPKRWEECLKSVDNTLGLMAGRYFVLRAFGGKSKELADQIIMSLKDAFIKQLPRLDWLDKETREKAIEKVNRIIQKIGFPSKSPDTMSPQSLAEYYEKINIEKDRYFGNILSAHVWASENKWKKVGKPVDLGQWYMTPQTVNAYYNPTANEIVFPAGILQSPFFSARAPEYVNYGAIGMVVGHELTHAFDNNGRQYDANGKLIQWWSNTTIEAFEEKAKCFVYQYGNYTIDDPKGNPVNLNGVLTLEAFHAWLTRFESDKNEKLYNNQLLPGLQNFTREQLFYISFGRVWCSKIRPETAVERVRVDPHSPAIWRVNGVLTNSNHFSETFKCKVGSKMNPVDKCSIW
ncbi:11336_t:CDS:10 [Funneliformis mosseae]|uniref:11336_t:CDS:1 n=1 Tax=Funneliformis mosseae TaxID=27381 RepID=A0A9N9BGK7_FUNMO|nr:11336_t:CDS:10 [Funneliformis mosseae]